MQTLNSRPVLISTPEASPKYDDSYMGYSVTVGDFAGQGIQSVAVGVPRGSELRGLVCLSFDFKVKNNNLLLFRAYRYSIIYSVPGCVVYLGITNYQKHQRFPNWGVLRLQSRKR